MAFEPGKYIPEELGDERQVHPQDVYTPAMHAANLDLLKDYLAELGESEEDSLITPWMLTQGGIARVYGSKHGLTAEIAENDHVTHRDIFISALGSHYVKHRIVMDDEGYNSRKSITRVYVPMHQRIGITLLNQPISAGMMMDYPSVKYNPSMATSLLADNLAHPQHQTVAKHEDLTGALAQRPIHKIGWGQIRFEP